MTASAEAAPRRPLCCQAGIRLRDRSVYEIIQSSWVSLTRNQQEWKVKVKTHSEHFRLWLHYSGFLSRLYLETGRNQASELERGGSCSDKSERSEHWLWFIQRIPSVFIFALAEWYVQLFLCYPLVGDRAAWCAAVRGCKMLDRT